MAKCKECGYPLLPKYDKCPKCGASCSDYATEYIDGVDIVSNKTVWSIAPGLLARKISEKELSDNSSVNGVVIQDGVTAAIFVDGQLSRIMDGGMYIFHPEKVIEHTNTYSEKEETYPTKKSETFGERVSSFVKGLMGGRKQNEIANDSAQTVVAYKEVEQDNSSTKVVGIYLISNRLFHLSLGYAKDSEGRSSFKPYQLKSGLIDLEIGLSIQFRICDFTAFRLNYLNDQHEISITNLQEMISPWVQHILTQIVEPMQITSVSLTSEQQENIKQQLKTELEKRLSGIEVVQIMNVTTDSKDLEQLRKIEQDLWRKEQEADLYMRKTEFLNRYTNYQHEQELTELNLTHEQKMNIERENLHFLDDMNKLNRDKLLNEDEMSQFVELHEMEVRLRRALQNADEQTRMMDVDKILSDIKMKKLMNEDEFAILEENIQNKRFERQQISDVLKHAALTKASIEKMRTEVGLYEENVHIDMRKDEADFEKLKQRTDFDIKKAEMEAALYGKSYVLEKQRLIDKLEKEGIELDANLAARRKQDDYDFENHKRKTEFNFDLESRQQAREDERQFRQDEHQIAKNKQNEEQRKQRMAFDFDLEKQRKTFNFDLDQQSKDADIERTLKLDEHEQEIANIESRRRMGELEQKASIAMRNMQIMQEAKRIAKQDELQHEQTMQQAKFDAEERRMQTQKEMTAEQIMAVQIREMDASAQAKFAESFSAGKNAEREKEIAKENAIMYEQMTQKLTDMAKMGFQANANVATGRIDALKETLQTSPITVNEKETIPDFSNSELSKVIRLNTKWLRENGYNGSFNDLAKQLMDMGGNISQDFDEQGNPIIVVEQLSENVVTNMLTKVGIKFSSYN